MSVATALALAGTYESSLGGAEAVWQLPPAAPIGIFFVAHGCSHSATDFFPHSTSCPSCIGLPEELRVTRSALAAGYAVLAVSSQDRVFRRCWSFEEDGPAVVKAVGALKAKVPSLAAAPVAAMGASSGGAFVLQLPQLLPLKAVVSQIMAIPPQMLEHPSPFPPTLFVHMSRDERTSAMVHRCVRKLRGGGSAAAQLLVRPLPITPTFFSDRIDGLDAAASKQVVDALASARLVGADGQLSDDPRATDWRSVVKAAQQAGAALPGVRPGVADSLEADASAVSEVLNVAWAMHEITSDPMGEILHFVAHARLPNDSHRANGSQRTELRAI